jgi:nicotinamidase-related amidase
MKTMLLVIDAQNYFVNDDTLHVFESIVDYIEARGKKYDHIVFTKHINNKSAPLYKITKWKDMIKGKETEIWKGLKPFAKKVFTKDVYSIFNSVDFLKFLKENNISKIDVCGFNLGACVNAAVIDGLDHGYETFLIRDLTGDFYNEPNVLENIKINIGEEHII